MVHLDDRKGVNLETKSGLVGAVHAKKLAPQDRGKLSVYAFVTSQWMRYPDGNRMRSHTFRVNPVTGDAAVVVDMAPEVPENCWLHLTLISSEKDVRFLREADAEVARAVVDLRQACMAPVTTKLVDTHDPRWDAGKFVVRLHPESRVGTGSAFGVPWFGAAIRRMDPLDKQKISDKWVKANYESAWKRYRSDARFPTGEVFTAKLQDEVVETTDGTIPMLFYLYHASRFEAEDPTEFADCIIRLGCLRAGVTVKEVLALKPGHALTVSVLCYALNGLPLALGYVSDSRGSAYGLPVASDTIARAPGMCVEFATLVTVAHRAINSGTSPLCRKMKDVLAGYQVCTAMCTSRAGGLEIGRDDSISRHLTSLLVPKAAIQELSVAPEKKAPASSARHLSLFVDTLEEVQPSPILPTPGSLSDYEICVLDGVLPYTMSSLVAFDVKSARDASPGPRAFYRSVMKLFTVDGGVLKEFSCLRRSGKEWVIGIEMMDFVCKGLPASDYRLHCALPIRVDSPELAAFESDFQETLLLTNLYQKVQSPVYLTEAKVEEFVRHTRGLSPNQGWRFGLYVMKEKEDVQTLQNMLDQFLGKVPALSKRFPKAGVGSAQAEILDLVNVTGEALSACVLLTYEAKKTKT
jgi:hypothetical protein